MNLFKNLIISTTIVLVSLSCNDNPKRDKNSTDNIDTTKSAVVDTPGADAQHLKDLLILQQHEDDKKIDSLLNK